MTNTVTCGGRQERDINWEISRYKEDGQDYSDGKATKLVPINGFHTVVFLPERFHKQVSPKSNGLHIADPDIVLTDMEWYKKLEPISSSIRQHCQTLAIPAINVSVDEMMVRFFGRSKHTVRMPKKAIKEGYKIFA